MPESNPATPFFPHLGPNGIAVLATVVELYLDSPIGRRIIAAAQGSRDAAREGVLQLLRDGHLRITRTPGPVTSDTKFSMKLSPAGLAIGQAALRAQGEAGA